jgi:hypothetical protein
MIIYIHMYVNYITASTEVLIHEFLLKADIAEPKILDKVRTTLYEVCIYIYIYICIYVCRCMCVYIHKI